MSHRLVLGLILVTFGCGDNSKTATTDARVADAPAPDAPPDAPPDATPSELIAAAKATADGTGLVLPISHAVVTYLKPQIGNTTNDPAGFTIQAQQMGPALFVSVDPASTTPPLVRGDTVSFTITSLVTVGGQKRASGLSNLVRHSQGFDVTTLSQDVTTATDLVTAIDNYDSELVDITGTLATFSSSGSSFEKSTLTTTGISGNAMFVVRVPSTLRDALDLVPTCGIRLEDTPVGRFNAETQLAAFTPSDVALSGCPEPTVVSALELTATSVRITFSRNILPGSVMADGSQFTFDNGLVASAATVSGRTVTVTTGAQASGTTYTVTVASSVRDLQGSSVAAPATATFLGFEQPASVRINEVNANIVQGCDLIELRVTTGGTLRGIRVQERNGGNGELRQDLPAVTVAKNDIVVLHLNSNNTTMCNPGTSTNETTAIDQHLAATFARNYDTAWDVFSIDTGLTATDNVITVFDRFGVMTDVVFIDDDVAPTVAMPSNVAASTETAAAAAASANMWQIVGGGTPAGGFVDDNFRLHAVLDSDAATSVAHTGANSESLHRVDDTDDDDKADWLQGANTWGLINAGQSPLP